jgi:hypothetical protein
LTFLSEFLQEPHDPGRGFALHQAPSIQVPLGEQLAILLDVDMTRVVVADPRDEDVPTSADLLTLY